MTRLLIHTWNRLDNFFHNKSARALNLDSQFTNTKLEQFDSVKPYSTRLKTLADSLKNVGDQVSDNRMALQLLKGLSDEYKSSRTSVQHLKPLLCLMNCDLCLNSRSKVINLILSLKFVKRLILLTPLWPLLRTSPLSPLHPPLVWVIRMAIIGNQKGKARDEVVLETPTSRVPIVFSNKIILAPLCSSHTAFSWPAYPCAYWPQPTWPSLPYPYPSQHLGPTPYAPVRPGQQAGILRQSPNQAHYVAPPPSHGYMSTNIDQAMYTMSLVDPNYYMDTGSTSHMTNSEGNLSPHFHLSNHVNNSIIVGNGSNIPIKGWEHASLHKTHFTLKMSFMFPN
ncbi:Transcription elongation factor SPT5 [Bienertia sinuspersici]